MGELEAYAALRDPDTGIEVPSAYILLDIPALILPPKAGPYERIWQSDKLIPTSLKEELVSAVAPLETVPDAEKDWHPGSNRQVLDLVHPSLWPVVYGRTVYHTSLFPFIPRDSDIDAMFISQYFQWLPSDFHVGEDGSVRLISPYINNIHPEDHKVLTGVVTGILEKAVPMFEWVLSDLERETPVPTRLDLKGRKFPDCVWSERVRLPYAVSPGFALKYDSTSPMSTTNFGNAGGTTTTASSTKSVRHTRQSATSFSSRHSTLGARRTPTSPRKIMWTPSTRRTTK